MTAIPCRLCRGRAQPLFKLTYLCRLDVQIYGCEECESLQTEQPYWLDISYARELMGYGTDTATRCMNLEAWVTYVALVFGKRPSKTRVIDYGSGPGLLVRMLRDVGFEAFAYDPYTPGMLAGGYAGDVTAQHDILVAIETWEHFADPEKELDQMFAPGHDLLVVRTQPYRGEGPSWYYFFPETGQHIFFYSHKAREWIAKKYGYSVRSYGDMSIFSKRPMSRMQQLLLDYHALPLLGMKALLPLAPRDGLRRDMDLDIRHFREFMAKGDWAEKVRELERAHRATAPSE
ncbi:MAG: class I SAM-dependent methyltransferase [Deltaproteobacteria bacterium]|nr:class I SAM-dependent methyltransferase [Deltaproteobacteria bacterium]